jgi:hypothetical protein
MNIFTKANVHMYITNAKKSGLLLYSLRVAGVRRKAGGGAGVAEPPPSVEGEIVAAVVAGVADTDTGCDDKGVVVR